MDGNETLMGKLRNKYKILVLKTKGKGCRSRHAHIWEDDIKNGFK
jgi:hypothetical protein